MGEGEKKEEKAGVDQEVHWPLPVDNDPSYFLQAAFLQGHTIAGLCSFKATLFLLLSPSPHFSYGLQLIYLSVAVLVPSCSQEESVEAK